MDDDDYFAKFVYFDEGRRCVLRFVSYFVRGIVTLI